MQLSLKNDLNGRLHISQARIFFWLMLIVIAIAHLGIAWLALTEKLNGFELIDVLWKMEVILALVFFLGQGIFLFGLLWWQIKWTK